MFATKTGDAFLDQLDRFLCPEASERLELFPLDGVVGDEEML
jgi:hypothetical protein